MGKRKKGSHSFQNQTNQNNMANSNFLEKNLEDIISENISTIEEKGFPYLLLCTKRQFPLPSGRFIDLVSFQIEGKNITLRVFELKRRILNFDSLTQLYSYCIELYTLLYPYFDNINIDKFLIGAEIEFGLQLMLSHVADIEAFTYEYKIDGISFKRFNPLWERTNEELLTEFKPTKTSAIFHQGLIDLFLDNLNVSSK